MSKDKNIFTVNDTVLYKNKEYIISRFETLNNILLVGLVNLTHLVNLKDIEHISNEYKILETRISNNLQQVIWKVKRLSDGEIFTVGDEITYEVITTGKNRIISSKINKFYIDLNNKLRINFDLDRENINTNCYLKDAVKSKVLFRTEDGVDIYEGDKTCWINNWTVTNFTDWKRNGNTKELHFSTKEAAEEYILLNKPCLSINDLSDYYYTGKKSLTLKKLKDLVKSKL